LPELDHAEITTQVRVVRQGVPLGSPPDAIILRWHE
jgi:hypothetical protein